MQKQQLAAAATRVDPSDLQLLQITTPKQYTKAKHQMFLKLCVEKSGVLGKNESKNIAVLKEKDVTYLRLLAAVEKTQKKLSDAKRKYDNCFPSDDENVPWQSYVEEIDNKVENKEDEEMLELFMEV